MQGTVILQQYYTNFLHHQEKLNSMSRSRGPEQNSK